MIEAQARSPASGDVPLVSHPPRPRFALRIGVAARSPQKREAIALLKPGLERLYAAIEQAGAAILQENAVFYSAQAAEFRLVSRLAGDAEQVAVATCPSHWLVEAILSEHDSEHGDIHGRAARPHAAGNAVQACLKRASTLTRFPLPQLDKTAQAALTADSYMLRQIDILIVIWDGKACEGGDTGAIAMQAHEGGIPVVWLSTTANHAPRLIAGFDEQGNAIAPETDCTAGPLLYALQPLVGGPTAVGAAAKRPPQQALRDFYAETWRSRCYFVCYDMLLRLATARLPRLFMRGRSFRERCRDWERFLEAAPQAGELKERLRQILLPRFVWADALAVHFSHRYRSAYVLAYFCSALAVFAGLAGALVQLRGEGWAALTEFILLAIAVTAICSGRIGRWHERWLDYRTLAETLRHARFLAFLSEFGRVRDDSKQIDRSRAWTLWYIRATMRELGLPSAVLDSSYQWRILSATLTQEIEEQIRYHESTGRAMHRIDRLLHDVGLHCILLTLLILLAFLVGWAWEYQFGDLAVGHALTTPGHVPYALKGWLVYFTAGLPALGAALAAIRAHGEFESAAQRSHAMVNALSALRTDYEQAMQRESRSEATAKQLITTSRVMSEDLAAWEELYGRKRLELPA